MYSREIYRHRAQKKRKRFLFSGHFTVSILGKQGGLYEALGKGSTSRNKQLLMYIGCSPMVLPCLILRPSQKPYLAFVDRKTPDGFLL